jgi:hypothetical protein
MNTTCKCGHEKERHDVAGSCQVMTESTINFCPCTSFQPSTVAPAPKEKLDLSNIGSTTKFTLDWDSSEGQTHSYGDGCGELAHNAPKEPRILTQEDWNELHIAPKIEEIVTDFSKVFVNHFSSREWERLDKWLRSTYPLYAKGEYERGRGDVMFAINDTATFLSGGRAKTAEEFRDEVKEKLAQKVNSA